MSSILWDALMFLCAVGPLIIFHELGHYWVGRWCGVRAETFSIGFGKEVAGWTDKRGTRWKIGWLPLGGYVKFAGEYELDGSPAPRQPFDGFETAKLSQRALIIAAGPLANFIIAFLIYCVLIAAIGEVYIGNKIDAIEKGSIAQSVGFQAGDQIIMIDGHATPDFDSIRSIVSQHPNQQLRFQLMRGGHEMQLTAAPALKSNMDQFHVKTMGGHLGLAPQIETRRPAWYAIPGAALSRVGKMTTMIATVIEKIFTGQLSSSLIGGPLQSAKVAAEAASYGAIVFCDFIAFISINLGFMNLLPVPVLDGGHLMLYGVEAVRRRPLTAKTREAVFRTGLVMLMSLFVFVTINDLGSFGLWKRLADLIG
jgi:regulator of sigma E protease